MATEARLRANEKYDRQNTVRISLKLNRKTDADILEQLERVASKQGYIKELIRRDIRRPIRERKFLSACIAILLTSLVEATSLSNKAINI